MSATRTSSSSAPSQVEPGVVWLHGECDSASIVELCEVLCRAMSRDAGDLVVDLSDVQFIASATVGVLLRTRKRLEGESRALLFRAPSIRAKRVLDVLGLEYLPAVEWSRTG